MNQWSLQFYNRIAYHDYEGIAINDEERGRLVTDLRDKMVLILRNHGLVTIGNTIGNAFKKMYNLERSCRAQLAIQASGAKIRQIPKEVCELTASQYELWENDLYSGDPEWDAYMRLVEENYPDFCASSTAVS